MSESAPNPYDQVAYASHPFSQTHPDRLATLATLFGLQPAPVTQCRVLELGCGEGANLIPMAFGLPESRFIGVDLAARPVAAGQAKIAELELENIELRCLDIREVDRSLGQFDYVIAHGVYSWVPAEVRERMLAICGEMLAPHGVAFISYNLYPGYYLREMAREMMLFHVEGISEPAERVEQGLALLKLMLARFPNEVAAKADLYGAVMFEQLERMLEYRHNTQVFHDELAPINRPVWFHDFMQQADAHGLQYLAEANFFEMQDYLYPPPIRDFLRQFGPDRIVEKEQYLDFFKCRGFRQTLLCRREAVVTRAFDLRQSACLYVESPARYAGSPPDLRAEVVQEFRGPLGARLQTDHPLAKAALWHLGEASPLALRWDELLAGARSRLNGVHGVDGVDGAATGDGEAERRLAEILTAAYGAGVVELHVYRPPMVVEASDRPMASRLARFQAGRGEAVANLLHKNVELKDALSRRLVQLLDGTRDRAALRDDLARLAEAEGLLIGAPRPAREIIAEKLEENLSKCAHMGLLVG